MAQGKKKSVAATVWDIAEPLVSSLGLTLWDVRYVKEGANRYLRIIIDKEGGVCIDDCVAVNDALDAPLDEADPIDESYNLQVCSAGIERELTRDFHFEKNIGAKIMVKLPHGVDGTKLLKGVLKDYTDGVFTIEMPAGNGYSFSKKEVSSVKLDDFEGFTDN